MTLAKRCEIRYKKDKGSNTDLQGPHSPLKKEEMYAKVHGLIRLVLERYEVFVKPMKKLKAVSFCTHLLTLFLLSLVLPTVSVQSLGPLTIGVSDNLQNCSTDCGSESPSKILP